MITLLSDPTVVVALEHILDSADGRKKDPKQHYFHKFSYYPVRDTPANRPVKNVPVRSTFPSPTARP